MLECPKCGSNTRETRWPPLGATWNPPPPGRDMFPRPLRLAECVACSWTFGDNMQGFYSRSPRERRENRDPGDEHTEAPRC